MLDFIYKFWTQKRVYVSDSACIEEIIIGRNRDRYKDRWCKIKIDGKDERSRSIAGAVRMLARLNTGTLLEPKNLYAPQEAQ